MGLIKTLKDTTKDAANSGNSLIRDVLGAGLGAVTGALESELWKEYFTSGDMSDSILMKRAEKVSDKRGRNKADENVITNGSAIDVQVNQCMIIVENGAIVEFCTEPGRYTYDASTQPSLLSGDNNAFENLKQDILTRWQAGGQRFSTQRVYFINMGKVWEPILWGTGGIPFRNCHRPAAHTNALIDFVKVSGYGTCEIKIGNPMVFFNEIGSQIVGGDNDGIIRVEDAGIEKSAKSAINSAIMKAISQLSDEKEMNFSQIGMYHDDIIEYINKHLKNSLGKKGIEVFEFLIDKLQPSEEDIEKINKSYDQYKEAAFFATNQQDMANYNLARQNIRNLEGLGKNTGIGGGAGGGMNIWGLGQGMNAMGAMGNLQYQQPVQQPQTPQQNNSDGWTCTCGHTNTGKFCANCGGKKPEVQHANGWTCSCGTVNSGKFCSNCGSKKPEKKTLKCDKCGHVLQEGKFCPECGDIINEADYV